MEVAGRGQACEQGRVSSFPLPSSGTWGLSAPGGLRAAGPACSSSACTPCSLRPEPHARRPPTLSAQHRLTRPAPGEEGKLGRVPPRPPRVPQSPRKAASNRRPRAPGRPIPPRRLRGPRRALPARPGAGLRAPEPGEGRRPTRPDGAGHFCDLQLLRGIRGG